MIPPMELALYLIGLGAVILRRRLRRQLASGAKANVMVTLRAGAVWSTTGRPGITLHCARGVVWLTQTGDGRDIVLGVGTAFTSERRGKLVVTALEPAVIARQDEKAPS